MTQINFTATPGNTCRGCLFQRDHSTVCHAMTSHAIAYGLPDCDGSPDAQGFIYVATNDLVGMVEQGEKV